MICYDCTCVMVTDLKERDIEVSPRGETSWVCGLFVSIGVFGFVGIVLIGGVLFFLWATPVLSEGGMRQTAAIVFQGGPMP